MSLTTYAIQIPAFEGPLDLLLQLIEREELDITAISLARVTDQYLEIIEELGHRTMADLTAFLVVGAKLVLIKSQALLPRPPSDALPEEDVATDLIRQLEDYRRYKQAAQELRQKVKTGHRAYLRLSPAPPPEPTFDLSDTTLRGLVAAAQEAMSAKPVATDDQIKPVVVTVAEQIERIQDHLKRSESVCFQDVLHKAAGRVEVIVTLLAVLQLLKRNQVKVWQDELFGPIFIAALPPAETVGDGEPSP
jgi:segregation and condensation protein A